MPLFRKSLSWLAWALLWRAHDELTNLQRFLPHFVAQSAQIQLGPQLGCIRGSTPGCLAPSKNSTPIEFAHQKYDYDCDTIHWNKTYSASIWSALSSQSPGCPGRGFCPGQYSVQLWTATLRRSCNSVNSGPGGMCGMPGAAPGGPIPGPRAWK